MRLVQLLWMLLLAAVSLTGCVAPVTPGNSNATLPSPLTSPQLSPITTPTEDEALKQAISDLAARLSTEPAAIDIVSNESAIWPNAGLGCPQPGINYPDVQHVGSRIILGYAGNRYEYHAGGGRVVLCEKSGPSEKFTAVPLVTMEPPEPGSLTTTLKIEPGMQVLIDTATADLMQRLSVTRDAVGVVSAQSVMWPDKSLGCPQPGLEYLQVQVDGYRIELRANNQVYAYHGGGGRGPFLCQNAAK